MLLTLASVADVSDDVGGFASGGIFFLGLGVTFLLVWRAPTPHGRMTWAIFPALALLVMGVLLATPFAAWTNLILPLALVLGGGYLLYRTFRSRTG